MNMSGDRVLLVEDDRLLRRACEVTLCERGFSVLTAENGEEGLRLARAERPDLILLDMLMPRLSGLDTLRALRADASTQAIRVLILSNSSREQDIQEVASLGAGYLVKANLSLKELGDRVTQLLKE